MIGALRLGAIALGLLGVTAVLLPVHLLALLLRLRLSRRIPRLWHRATCFLLGIRIRVHGTPEPRRPLMIAANHASWKDILVLGATLDVVYVAKAEVRDWPVFGVLARLQRTIFIVREEKRRVGEQADEIAGRLRGGEIVVLFPEGTTSDGNRLMAVKSSLFGAATAAVPHVAGEAVHVQPVAIAYTGLHGMPMGRYHRPIAAWPGDIELMPHLRGILREGAIDVDVTFGDTVTFTRASNRKQNAQAIETALRRMLARRLWGRDHD